MWKKITSSLLFFPLVFLLNASVNADAPNVLSDYVNLDWVGDPLYLDKESNSIYFKRSDGKNAQEATVTLDVEQSSTGFLFYMDAGNGNNRGDSGYCIIRFLDENNRDVLSRSTGLIAHSTNYVRYYFGEDEKFYPLPKNAKKVKIQLNVDENSSGERVNVYFRNFSLFFSNEMPLCEEEDNVGTVLMKNSTSLSKVEIGLTPYTRWIWVGIVFMVAMAFYLIRVWRQKYSTPKLNNKK